MYYFMHVIMGDVDDRAAGTMATGATIPSTLYRMSRMSRLLPQLHHLHSKSASCTPHNKHFLEFLSHSGRIVELMSAIHRNNQSMIVLKITIFTIKLQRPHLEAKSTKSHAPPPPRPIRPQIWEIPCPV